MVTCFSHTIESLVSTDTVVSLATTMASAGILQGVSGRLGLPFVSERSLQQHLSYHLASTSISAGLNMAVYHQDLHKAILSVANAVRLRAVLSLQEANILDRFERLTAWAIKKADILREGQYLHNQSVISQLTKDGSVMSDWGKYTSPSITLSNGQRIEVH